MEPSWFRGPRLFAALHQDIILPRPTETNATERPPCSLSGQSASVPIRGVSLCWPLSDTGRLPPRALFAFGANNGAGIGTIFTALGAVTCALLGRDLLVEKPITNLRKRVAANHGQEFRCRTQRGLDEGFHIRVGVQERDEPF